MEIAGDEKSLIKMSDKTVQQKCSMKNGKWKRPDEEEKNYNYSQCATANVKLSIILPSDKIHKLKFPAEKFSIINAQW